MNKKFKNIILFISIVTFLFIGINQTIAYLITRTSPLIGTFKVQFEPTGDIVISNKLTHELGEDYVYPENISFEYEVNLGSDLANKKFITSEGEFITDENGIIKLNLKPDTDITILDIKDMTNVTITLNNSLPGFNIDGENSKEVLVKYPEVFNVDYSLIYNPTTIKTDNFSLNVEKILNREWSSNDKFTFILEQKINNEWIEIGTKDILYSDEEDFNKTNFNDIISTLELTKVGNYDFRFYEEIGSLDKDSYDKTINTFRIVVTDNDMDGALEIKEVIPYENVNITKENNNYTINVEFNNSNDIDNSEIDYVDKPEKSEDIEDMIVVKDDTYTIETVLSKFEGLDINYTYTVHDKTGKEIEMNKVRTGDFIKINTDDKTYTYYMVLKGDVSGDGEVTPLDYVKVKNHIMGQSSINKGVYKIAADYNDDDSISPLDYVKIKNHIMYGGK